MVKKQILLYFLILLGLSLLLPDSARAQPLSLEWLKESPICEKIGDFRLQNLSGRYVSLNEYIDGNSSLLLFWTTWCPYCRQTIKQLAQTLRNLDNSQFKFILINVGESKEKVQKFLSQFEDKPFIALLDYWGEVAADCEVIGIPMFIGFDDKGEVELVDNYLPEDYLERVVARKGESE